MWRIRPARKEDLPAIDALVASVGGDREDLVTDQFLLAQEQQQPEAAPDAQQIIGCGRLKPYPGFCELASLMVREEWRVSGVGRELVSRLLERHQGPVYLICEDDVVDFFRRFGFRLIHMSEALPGLATKLERYVAELGHMNVMRRD
jgi:N-acetylglutamate synthase-like GNAT family acetyltransferase